VQCANDARQRKTATVRTTAVDEAAFGTTKPGSCKAPPTSCGPETFRRDSAVCDCCPNWSARARDRQVFVTAADDV
jgi:hypothetical protein